MEKKSVTNRMAMKFKLAEDMITIHNKKNCRSITFNQKISNEAHKMNLEYVVCDSAGKIRMATRDLLNYGINHGVLYQHTSKITYIACSGGNYQAVINNIGTVQTICNKFNLPEGDYYFQIMYECGDETINILLIRVLHTLPVNPNKVIDTKSAPSVLEATDQQLCDELRKRGFDCKVTKLIEL